jgi:transposase
MSKRRTHSPEFKARVAMEAVSGRKTIQEIAADHAIHPIQVSQWKRQLLDSASELFTRGKKSTVSSESQGPRPRHWCNSLGTSTPATPGLSAQLRHPAQRSALQEVGRPVTLVRVPPQPDEPCPRVIVPQRSWHRYWMAAQPGS